MDTDVITWPEAIDIAEQEGGFSNDDKSHASDWKFCAVGEGAFLRKQLVEDDEGYREWTTGFYSPDPAYAGKISYEDVEDGLEDPDRLDDPQRLLYYDGIAFADAVDVDDFNMARRLYAEIERRMIEMYGPVPADV